MIPIGPSTTGCDRGTYGTLLIYSACRCEDHLLDTFEEKVRLPEIDIPERRQPYGKKAKQVLSDKIYL